MTRILTLRTGGQSGVDRAALDVAYRLGLPYTGWCPKEGWAEDFPHPPGLMLVYPQLRETPLPDPTQRTEWNVRDSDATMILRRGSDSRTSRGTDFTVACAARYRKPCRAFDLEDPSARTTAQAWLLSLGAIHDLNIAGPRETEAPGIHAQAVTFLETLLAEP